MKKGFLLFLCLFLVSCVSGGEYAEKKFFVDSNVSADVYCDGKYIGTTPLELDTSLKCKLKIEKEGYRSTSFRFQNLEKYVSFPKEKISKHHGLVSGAITSLSDSLSGLSRALAHEYRRDPFAFTVIAPTGLYLYVGPYIVVWLAAEGVCVATEVALDIVSLPADIATIGAYASENANVSENNFNVTSYNAMSINVVMPYDGDSFFFELLPNDKKTFNRQDLHELRTKLFVLKNFNELKFQSPEYVKALEFLVGKKPALPAPAMSPGEYFRTVF